MDTLSKEEIAQRLGTSKPDGARNFPERNINGDTYTRPGSTLALGGGNFIVLPAVASVPDEAQIAAWKTMLGLNTRTTISRSVSSGDES